MTRGRLISFIPPWGALGLSPLQPMAFLLAAAAVVLVFAARLMNAEASARRMGLFLYVFVAVLVLALFALVAGQGELTLFSGALP